MTRPEEFRVLDPSAAPLHGRDDVRPTVYAPDRLLIRGLPGAGRDAVMAEVNRLLAPQGWRARPPGRDDPDDSCWTG